MTIVVVAAIVEQADCFLLTQRQAGVHLEGRWEFPGGKVHEGETHEAALTREMLEELGVAVSVGDLVLETAHDYPDRRTHLHFYNCTLHGTPTPLLGQQMRWVPRTGLASLPFPEADAVLIQHLSTSP